MKKRILLALIVSMFLLPSIIFGQGFIIDHNCTDLQQIPTSYINQAKTNIKWHYAHASHGQQLITGMDYIEIEDPLYATTWGVYLPTVPNNLCVYNGNCGFQAEHAPTYWTPTTCTFTTLNQNPTLNVSQFEWCDDLNDYSEAQVNQYLDALNAFGQQYPNVIFVYTTAPAENGESLGYNRHLRNEQIRAYCAANNKVLFDFADIDSWYDGNQNTYTYNGQQIPIVNSAYTTGLIENHVNQLGNIVKGRAAWWLMARLAGWSGTQATPIIIDHNCVDVSQIPASYIADIKTNTKLQWCGQSHSSQGLCGLDEVEGLYPNMQSEYINPDIGMGWPVNSNNYLEVFFGNYGFDNPGCCTSITPEGYWRASGVEWTQDMMTIYPFTNVSIFNWCWQLQSNNSAYVQTYLNQMEAFEDLYPNCTFVYTTNNAQAYGTEGITRAENNQMIRDYCIANNKVLFDFADLDCWWNGEHQMNTMYGVTYEVQHPAFDSQICGHVNLLGAEQKGRAIWWLLARIRGWSGVLQANIAPVITDQSFNINENSINGTTIGTIVATDPDAGQVLTYAIISGNIDNAFQLSSNGLLTVNSVLNYENISSYNLIVEVTDDGSPILFSQATISVNVSDINESPIIVNQTFSKTIKPYPYPYPFNGVSVGFVVASDPDFNQSLTYSIINGNMNNKFYIISNTGELIYMFNDITLWPAGTEKYVLKVQVKDNGNPQMGNSADIYVAIYKKYTIGNIGPDNIITIFAPESGKLKLFNSYGQLIYEENITQSQVQINSSNFKKGVYLVVIYGDSKIIYSDKIILK